MPAALDDVLDDGYLGDLPSRPIEDLRAMRAECQEIETGLSMLRRVVQGHLDIVGVELARRADGGAPSDVGELVDRLPEALADRTMAGGVGRLSQLLAPESLDPALEAELDALVGASSSVDLSTRDDAALRTLVEGLGDLEVRLSAHRRTLFDRLDALQEEIARRYRTGETSVDSLLP
jgi:hypothetical protein